MVRASPGAPAPSPPKKRLFGADEGLRRVVAQKLGERWSPAQISRWLRRCFPKRRAWHVCTETIYEALYRGLIVPAQRANLRTGRTYRHRRGRGRSRDGALRQCTAMRSIHERPAIVESRHQAGHWEGDLIVGAGQRSAVATLVERKMRLTMLVPLTGGHTAPTVADGLIAAFSQLPSPLRRTLTWDQGNELFQHARIEHETGLRIYLAEPHSPWQRGTNENTNGLLRQYFPKGACLTKWSAEQFHQIVSELNDRPRLCLNDRSPTRLLRRWERRLQNQTIRLDQ